MNDKTVIVLILLAAILVLGGAPIAVKYLTRGLRNNNPGNIRRSADQWQGLLPQQGDSEFFQFVSPEYGIRALARVLKNYQERHGLNTVRGIINRWAPPTENDTGAYVNAVAQATGLPPDQPIDVSASLFPIVSAIIKHENGMNPYPADLIQQGIAMA